MTHFYNLLGEPKMKNWKTTVAGIVTGLLNLNVNGITVKAFLLSAAIVALGTLAKDHSSQ